MALSSLKGKGSSAALIAIFVVISATAVFVSQPGEITNGEEIEQIQVPASCECQRLAQTGFAVKDSISAGVALALFIDRDYSSLKEWDQSVSGSGCPNRAYFLYYKTADKRTNVLGVTDVGEIYRSNLKCHENALSAR